MSHLICLCGALSTLIALSACASHEPPPAEVPEASARLPEEFEPTRVTPSETPAGAAPLGEAEPGQAKPVVETLLVRDQLAECVGEGTRKCLQVRASEGEAWRNFYAKIEGFEYEPSYAYELRVEVTRAAQPPADGSSLRYRLLEVVSKTRSASSAD
jgi:uncharacterized protein DUF4377